MKRWLRAIVPLAIGGLLIGLAGCQGDEGPQGPPGTEECMKCHTDNFEVGDNVEEGWYLRTIQTEFALSRHNLSDTYVRRGSDASPVCSRCHTTEGYQVYLETGAEAPLETSSHISCFACHAPHTNRDFSQRKLGATDLWYGGEFDREEANTCAVCHQARLTSPAIDDPNTPITSSRWGPHYAPQANILTGQGAWEFGQGTYAANAAHSGIAKGCVQCHMAELPENVIAGGHSFAINYESGGNTRVNSKGCTCHTTWTTDAIATTETDSYQAEFEETLDALGDVLVERGWLKTDSEYATNGATAPVTADERGAVFNFLILHHDKSMGVHNKVFAEAVVARTMAWLEANL